MNVNELAAQASKLSIPQLQQAMRDGSIPSYIGYPILQQKSQLEQAAQAAQAGYGLANQAGQNLTNIGTQQLAAQKDIIGLQNQMGAQQQAQQQNYINAAINNYANAQNAPMNAFNQYNALIRGLGSTQTQYAPPPSTGSQLAGLGTALGSAYMMTRKDGGVIKAYKSGGLVDLAIENAMGNA